MKKVKVNQETCIGCASCATICPQVFVMNKGKARAAGEPEGHEEEVKMARDACPVGAIKIFRSGTE